MIGQVFFFARDAIVLGNPFTEVDHSAAIGTERPERVIVLDDSFLADRTNDFLLCHDFV